MLAYFEQHVTMPFLNCVAKVDAAKLLTLQQRMFEELLQGNPKTLQEYEVPSRFESIVLTGELERKLHPLLCTAAAECLQRQSGAEYGFPGMMINKHRFAQF